VLSALAKMNPTRAVAPSGLGSGAVTVGYRKARGGKPAVMYELLNTSLGGTSAHDGVAVVMAMNHFTPGAPVEIFESEYPLRVRAFEMVRDSAGLVTLRMYRCLKPIIVAINGHAVGVGITFTLAADMRLVAEGAKIGFVFARRGIVPEGASSWFLPRLVGISRAVEWSMTGRLLTADEVKEGGLVRSVHGLADLLPAAYAIAREIADNTAPVSVALTRQMMWRSSGQAHPMEAHRLDSRGIYARGRTADAAEGVNSFLEKRSAVYPDKVSNAMPDFFPWWEEPDYK